MICELPVGEYHRVHALVAGLAYHLSIQAVIDGTLIGRIWVDDALAPQTVLVLTPEGHYLAGAGASSTLTQALADLLISRPAVHLTCDPAIWEPAMATLLACKFARLQPRHYFTLRRFLLPTWREHMPSGYEMIQVSSELLARQDLLHLDAVRERISAWRDFARDGFGFCVVHDNTIVSHCIADCVSGSACEVGVATHPAYRRRGLGTLTVAAAIEYCLDHNLPMIGWHCLANNRGSRRVAENVGFVLAGEYLSYTNGPVAENPDDLTLAEWHARAEFFQRAFGILNQHSAYIGWRAAEARAMVGDGDEALRLLHCAADTGALPPRWGEWLEESWAFQRLRTQPGWSALLARAHDAGTAELET